jgi:transposase
MNHIGVDLGKTSSQLCILTEEGELIERRIATTRESFTRLLGESEPARILLEASTESEWVAQHLETLGHEVIVADPNFAPMSAQRSRRVKTDRRDARALCEACRLGAYRAAQRPSERQRQLKRLLNVRESLVRTRARFLTQVRTQLRAEGIALMRTDAAHFGGRVADLELREELGSALRPLIEMLRPLNTQIDALDEELARLTREDPVIKRLCTVPGVGPVTATCFRATLDQASRFSSAKQVRSYLGLVPSEKSSGEQQHRGRITKAGNRRMRYLVVKAAWACWRSQQPGTKALREWAEAIATRRGRRIAAVALARKLAGLLYAIWRDETEFDAGRLEQRASRQAAHAA